MEATRDRERGMRDIELEIGREGEREIERQRKREQYYQRT